METTERSGVHVSDQRIDIALLLIRVAVGVVFLYHGSGKLFGAFGGPGLSGFAAFSHLPVPLAALVALFEFCGGAAVITGVGTRVGAAAIAVVMIGAIATVHLSHGFDTTKGGFEYPFTLLLVASALAIAGPGRYSLAAVVRKGPATGPAS